jgi:hypothetical protein
LGELEKLAQWIGVLWSMYPAERDFLLVDIFPATLALYRRRSEIWWLMHPVSYSTATYWEYIFRARSNRSINYKEEYGQFLSEIETEPREHEPVP